MKKQCRELMKKNNKREKAIHKNNDELYTNMIVYLRGSDMTEYNQELVREDLIEMILDGQNRGDDIQKVIGDNYKEICDEIIESMPKKTKLQKIGDFIETSLMIIWILGIIAIAQTVISNFIVGKGNWEFNLTLGYIINTIIMIISANLIVKYVCKTAFNNGSKKVSFIKTWIICAIVLGVLFISSYYLDYTIVNVSLLFVIFVVAIAFILERVLFMYSE